MSRVTATILVYGRALAASIGQLLVLASPNSNTLKVPAGTKNLVSVGGEAANPDKYAVINQAEQYKAPITFYGDRGFAVLSNPRSDSQ